MEQHRILIHVNSIGFYAVFYFIGSSALEVVSFVYGLLMKNLPVFYIKFKYIFQIGATIKYRDT